ncbi:TetR family transcriptional regulator [Streptomyces ficellus]|uniref:TetR family transcriptional regulator n=1 Tax=Streptomyces ficellus TaxID=1977088 RepID=A0ABT7ZDQ0_9ACTN|nr:TetR/AcrR family transcriptional regulator [Streptomyces ficellus]MDN3297578.1 TetR family transcriptional regulator [Streptomyces ficellus]
MSPRGVAIPDLRERLFDAAQRVLAREGPAALTSRAITTEAGCAKGLLHAHFDGLDAFVAELVLDRFARTARQAEELGSRAGHATVAENLVTVALTLVNSLHPTVVGLAMTRAESSARVRQALAAGAPGFASIEAAITAYLTEEQRLGRLASGTDTATVALALVGTVHHLLMTNWTGTPVPRERVERLVALLVGPAAAGRPEPRR